MPISTACIARVAATANRALRSGQHAGLAALVLLFGCNTLQNAAANGDTRTLSFHHTHTNEDITITYKRDGRYDDEALMAQAETASKAATQAADAAKQVKGLITTSASHVGHGVDLVGATEASLNEIVSQVAQVTTLISEIAKSSTEQSVALTEVNTAINDMDRVTQENAVMVEQSTTATHAMARQTADLDQLVARFRVGDRARRSRPAHQNDARSAPRSQAVNREAEAEVAGWNATGRMARHG